MKTRHRTTRRDRARIPTVAATVNPERPPRLSPAGWRRAQEDREQSNDKAPS